MALLLVHSWGGLGVGNDTQKHVKPGHRYVKPGLRYVKMGSDM